MRTAKGNALFLILIAVALFAALSYAITQSSRGSGSIAREDAELGVASMNNYAIQLQSTIQRLKVTNGVQTYNLSFANNVYQRRNNNLYDALGSPADPSLYIYHAGGGNLTPLVFTSITTSCSGCDSMNAKSGHMRPYWFNVPNLGSSAADLTMSIASITTDVCNAINRSAGMNSAQSVNDLTNYLATFTQDSQPGALTALPAGVSGKSFFCLRDNATGRYWYMSVLEIN